MKTFIKWRFPLLYYKLSRARRAMRRRRFRIREVQHTYAGFPLTVHLADGTGQAWYDCDWPMLPEVPLLQKSRLKPRARVFEIGAHQGIVAMIYARLVGEMGTVVAVEAEPFNAAVARLNKELNAIHHLHLVEAAVTERTGPLPVREGFDRSVTDRLLDWKHENVSGISLDDLSTKHGAPDVLICDVDGFECQVLRGGRATLAGCPDCMVEVHVGAGLEQEGGSVDEMLSFFPPEHWELWAAPGNWSEYVPFKPDLPLTKSRFMLVAMSVGRKL